jgi:hypothetical protein
MSEIVQLNKTVFGKVTYPNIINTEFTQLIQTNIEEIDTTINIDQFFQAYNDLFFEIPLLGDYNTHQELIKRSTEYIGVTQTSDEIEVLLEEINQLRLENLTLQQQIDDLTTNR